MTDRERLIELCRKMVETRENIDRMPGSAILSLFAEADSILAELGPQPRELWGRRPLVYGTERNRPSAYCGVTADPDGLHVYGPTRADAIRRYNAAAEAIERSDREAAK